MEVVKLTAHLIGERHDIPNTRSVDKARSQDLAGSIQAIGLLSPIIVRPGTRVRNGREVPGWDIISGRHRFDAMFRILHWDEIPCVVMDIGDLKSELAMIDENLIRRELSSAERAYQTARRKEIYEALHPEAAHGGDRKSSRQTGDLNEEGAKTRFTSATAKSTGRSERSIQRDARRGEALGADLTRIAGTSLDKPAEIDALIEMPKQDREAIVARAVQGETVSARAKDAAPKTVVHLDHEEMQANTIARRLMRDYLDAPLKAQIAFDALYVEAKRSERAG